MYHPTGNWKSLRRQARCACAVTGRKLSGVALGLHRRPRRPVEDLTVHMLVSSRTWHAGLLAAISLEQQTGRRWKFFIHEDGSVTEADRIRIKKVLSNARLISREESDAKMREVLGRYPACLEQRGQHNLFLKFSDFAAFAPGNRFIVLDSDVIFYRYPSEILDWVASGTDKCFYNEDTKEKYCIPRACIQDSLGIDMWPRFNSGLVLLPRASVDFALAEKLVTAFRTTAHHPQFFEQTLYGLMASAWDRGGALPPSYEISWGYFRRRGAVCRHYVGEFKHDLLYIEGAPLLLASILKKRFFGSP